VKVLLVAALALALFVAPESRPRVVSVHVGADTAKGFVVGDGRVVTVAHVLGRDVRVDGRPATVVRRDDRLDLALLAVPGVRGAPPRIGRSGARHLHARIDGSAWRRPVLELRTDVARGDSGTPVLTPAGRLAGVIFARSRDRAGVAYAVDASDPSVVDFVGL
jgi:S1-C subfamily serine protease